MKNIQHMLFKQIISAIFLIVFLVGTAFGQAGADQDVCEGESVTIGTENSASKCYVWEPATGLSDPRSGMPEATPTETTTYTVTVVGSDFSSRVTDQVTITIVDLESVTAEPKMCCWKKGQAITASQFEITTNPSTIKDQIEVTVVSPTTAESSTLSMATGEVEVTLRVTCGSNSEDITATITVVDEDFEISTTPAEFSAKKLEDKIARFAFGPCEPAVSISGGYSFAGGKLCCANGAECIKNYFKATGSIGASGGFTCSFPFAGIPYVAEANVVLGFGISGALEASVMTQCDGELKPCFEGKFGGSITGGVGIDVLGGKVIEAQLVLIGSASFPAVKKCKGEPVVFLGPVCGKVDIEGSVTFVSFYTKKVSMNVVPQGCF